MTVQENNVQRRHLMIVSTRKLEREMTKFFPQLFHILTGIIIELMKYELWGVRTETIWWLFPSRANCFVKSLTCSQRARPQTAIPISYLMIGGDRGDLCHPLLIWPSFLILSAAYNGPISLRGRPAQLWSHFNFCPKENLLIIYGNH